MSKMSRILVLALAFVPSLATASQIGSSFGKKTLNLHETFTALARTCANAARPERPSDCRNYFSRIAEARMIRDRSNAEAYSARWPDDPTRMLDSGSGTVRFGLNFLNHCRRALSRGAAIDQVGMVCSSHYGRLQFFHSQATAEDRSDPAVTRAKII